MTCVASLSLTQPRLPFLWLTENMELELKYFKILSYLSS